MLQHAREDSDTNLIVVSEDLRNMNLRERLEAIGLAAGRVFEPIETLDCTEEEIKNTKGIFLEEILPATPWAKRRTQKFLLLLQSILNVSPATLVPVFPKADALKQGV